ncbi:glyoxalase/bleomycin resistance/dioxygenase family protein [Albitalea terrae]|uniref:Glyoxalase/bleomycin resistance/dioxygenase family protein n=2 Tax=Piscinibacter terrae TaxID=2496871 RepID=A0A3N7HZK8_9BURK|nr:glyoxalase/bleomycin resistance/dioxygenase family protein [Albitalea terrae]
MVHVADPDAALAWYRQAFPSAVLKHVAEPHRFRCLDVDGVQLELVPADEKVGAGARGSVVYWRVTAFDEALARIVALGARAYRGPMDIEDGMRMGQVLDPWGNCIGLRGPR